jgi:hypothetical protein
MYLLTLAFRFKGIQFRGHYIFRRQKGGISMFKKLTDFFKSLFGIHAWIHYKHISFSQWSIILSKKELRMQNRPRGSNRWFINIFFDKWCFITEKDGSIIPDLQRTNTKKAQSWDYTGSWYGIYQEVRARMDLSLWRT